MYDQSFSGPTLAKMIRKGDFWIHKFLYDQDLKKEVVQKAIAIASTDFNGGSPPLKPFVKKKKRIFRTDDFPCELVLRKITLNLLRQTNLRQPNRQSIIKNLKLLLTEGVPFRIYRLDIQSFYESFATEQVIQKTSAIIPLSLHTKRLIETLLQWFNSIGGTGIPRGLALSSALSEMMMAGFDNHTKNLPDVYFYARYVDDIAIITSANENQTSFLKSLRKHLPTGLDFHETKQRVRSAHAPVSPLSTAAKLLDFSYLGYRFEVNEPTKIPNKRPYHHFRKVETHISEAKIAKYKTRICRSLADFSKTGDILLLEDRLKYLTNNFGIRDINSGGRKLIGIYYNYPHISAPDSLQQLDRFLHSALQSNHGRLFSKIRGILTKEHRRKLLKLSFERGHSSRAFLHFSTKRIHLIQECWAHD